MAMMLSRFVTDVERSKFLTELARMRKSEREKRNGCATRQVI